MVTKHASAIVCSRWVPAIIWFLAAGRLTAVIEVFSYYFVSYGLQQYSFGPHVLHFRHKLCSACMHRLSHEKFYQIVNFLHIHNKVTYFVDMLLLADAEHQKSANCLTLMSRIFPENYLNLLAKSQISSFTQIPNLSS